MDGIRRVDRVLSELDVWLDDSFPFAKMKVKVIQRAVDDMLAVANVGIRNLASREREYISGLGATADEAVNDLLVRFVSLVRANTPPEGLTEKDFEWSAPEDF